MEGNSPAELRRLPNVLSLSRVVLAVAFVPAGSTVRLVLVLLAAASDFLDGWLARRTNNATRWGALVDPIADRCFVVVAFLMYVLNGDLAAWELLVVLSRDIATATAFFVTRAVPDLRAVEFKARYPGKVVTVLQLAMLIALVLGVRQLTPLLAAIAVASLLAIGDYTYAVWRARGR